MHKRFLPNVVSAPRRAFVDDDSLVSREGGAAESLFRVFWASDLAAICSLLLWGLFLYAPGLGALEFFRHTEADRTLIAWEMLERGDFIIPHLLGSPILTKPPLFYWLVAVSLKLFGTFGEWVPRLPSVIAAIMLLLVQYGAVRLAGCSRGWAFLSALVLSTTGAFFLLASAAEIDMTFCLFNSLALYGVYAAVNKPTQRATLFAYAAAAAAFLAKGPPVILFFGATLFFFYLWCRRSPFYARAFPFQQLVRWNIIGIALFSCIVGLWLGNVLLETGIEPLVKNFDREIVQRIVSSGERDRGAFFYIGSFFVGFNVWALFLALGLALPLAIADHRTYLSKICADKDAAFFVFNAIAALSIVLLLSLAEGKSSRYLLPIYPFVANLTVFALLKISGGGAEKWLFRLGSLLLPIGIIVLVVIGFRHSFAGVSLAEIRLAAAALLIPLAIVSLASIKRTPIVAIGALILIMPTIGIGQHLVYTQHRNEVRSVKALAEKVNRVLPPGVPLYSIEMPERWVSYYLKHLGRQTVRLRPRNVGGPITHKGRVYLILSGEEEAWRVHQLRLYDRTVRVLAEVHGGRQKMLIVEASRHGLPFLELQKVFPTQRTLPSLPAFVAAEQQL